MNETKRNSGLATASMVLGIISFAACGGLLAAIPAVVCGHIARGKIKRGNAEGNRMASTGLILGYANIIISILLIPVFFFSLYGAMIRAKNKTSQISDANNLKQIGIALLVYADKYDGCLPPYNNEKGFKILLNSSGKPGFNDFGKYIYQTPGKRLKNIKVPSRTPVAWDKEGNFENCGNVLYIDGHIENLKGESWRDFINSHTQKK